MDTAGLVYIADIRGNRHQRGALDRAGGVGEPQVGSTQLWGAQLAGRWGSRQVLPQLHTTTPIFMPPPSWEGGQHWPLLPVCPPGCRSPPPPSLSACWPPPFVLRRHGPRGASAKPLADAQGPGLLPGSTRAMAWESPRLGELSSRLTLLPRPGGDEEEVQVLSQRQQQRWSWGGDGRQKEGVGWRERLA